MNILVIGGNRFVGKKLVKTLLKNKTTESEITNGTRSIRISKE